MSELSSSGALISDKNEMTKSFIEENNPKDLSEFFRLLSGETRIKILLALSKVELCVCELSEILNKSVSAISHQLKELRQGRLVKYRQEEGDKHRYYSLEIEHLEPILKQALEHLEEEEYP